MTRATNDRLQTETPRFVQIESNYTNFWILLESAQNTTPSSSKIGQRYGKLNDIREATSHYE